MSSGSNKVSIGAIALGLLVLIAPVVSAQSGGIAGAVKDASGGVLPGVSVEASSPALIEKVRTVVSDEHGQYKIIELPSGVYAVTFSLPGFNAVRREGIRLTTGFTANVNIEMAVGNLEETLTVLAESPVVDIQRVHQQQVFTAETVDTLPTGRVSTGFAQLVPGLNLVEGAGNITDVGGLLGEGARLVMHGSRPNDQHRLVNGSPANDQADTGSGAVKPDVGGAEEVVITLSANPAEYQRGGVIMNLIPKEGGNRFVGSFFFSGANDNFQSNNFSDDLKAQGLAGVNRLDKSWDVGVSVGGPVKRDKGWFYLSLRHWGNNNLIAGVFHDSVQGDFKYTPDLSRQASDLYWTFNQGLRMTWQVTPKNKIGSYVANQPRSSFGSPPFGLSAIEALRKQSLTRNWWGQLSWQSPATNRLLFESALSLYRNTNHRPLAPGVTPEMYAIRDTGTGFSYNAPPLGNDNWGTVETYRFVASYVTGSHAFKVGITQEHGENIRMSTVNNDINLTFSNGRPTQITLNTTPRRSVERFNAMIGVFAQDQWTIKRLTINPGVRFDYHNSSVPAQDVPTVRFLAGRHIDEVRNVPNWKDFSPRLGVAYDVFGDGKTALKASMSRYLVSELANLAGMVNPIVTTTNTANRTWTDNGNFVPECDFLAPEENRECGALGNLNFGKPNITTFFDPEYLNGSGVRMGNWETSVGIQQQLIPRVALNAGYFRRWYTDFLTTQNRAVAPQDFDHYCINAPADPRLPNGGSYEICGLYDVKLSSFARSDNFVTFASKFGEQTEVFDGVDVNINAQVRRGVTLAGGFSTGRTRTNRCFVVDTPQALYQCDVRPPFLTQVKFLGSYELPRGFQVSGTLQSYPGTPITATHTVPNSQIAPSLGRNLSSGANGTATVELIAPGTMFSERLNQMDLRFSKNFRVGSVRVKGNLDVYNLFNINTVLRMNTVYGLNWLQPALITQARLFRLGGQVDF